MLDGAKRRDKSRKSTNNHLFGNPVPDVLWHRLRHVFTAAEHVGQAAVHGLGRERQAVATLLEWMLNSQNL
jgi:hypothetical protein